MVAQRYRWDFIGLSTDPKPTKATSEKVTNGSTFYESNTSKLYVFYGDQWYEKTPTGGSGGTSDFDKLTNRPKYNGTAMTHETDIVSFTGTDGNTAGTAGLVPAPATTDAGKFLKADGTWDTAGGGGVTVAQDTGTSQTDVMSQNATTNMVFDDPSTKYNIRIGSSSTIFSGNGAVAVGTSTESRGNSISIGDHASAGTGNTIAIGASSNGGGQYSVALGHNATADNKMYSVALGYKAKVTRQGEIQVGTTQNGGGYNSTKYRVIGGVHDGQLAQDAVTVSQINGVIDAINTALNVNISHIGASS